MWKEWKGLKTTREYIDPQIHHYSTSRVPHDDACFLASILVVENNHRYPHNNCRRTPVPCTLPPSPSGLHPWLLVWCKSTTARPSGILTRMLNMILGLITWPENTLDASASQFKHRLHIVSWMSAYPEVCKAKICFYSYELVDMWFFKAVFQWSPFINSFCLFRCLKTAVLHPSL